MKLAIIGASAGIGLATVRQALQRGHTVTAMARNTDPIPTDAALVKINGSADSVTDLKKTIHGADAIIVTVGTKDKKKTTLFTASAEAIIAACTELQIQIPVLVVTGFGAGESRSYLSLFMRTVIRLFLKDQYENKTAMEKLFAESALQWEMVRPGMLSNGKLTKNYLILTDLKKGMRVRKISRNDVADYLLNEAENPKQLFQFPTLTT